jgi:N-dimethylarginine dimethylaminohydrolase
MVYAMNLGLGLVGATGDQHVVMSHMRYPQRRTETPAADDWFARHGFVRSTTGRDGVGAHFEAGDAFAWRGELVVGYGPRTEELALKHLAVDLGVSVRGFRITHPGMYHMDIGFCPLDETRAMVCPAAYDDASAEALLALVPEPLVLSEEEALTFCANSIVVGRTILMPACPDRVHDQLEEWGFEVVVVETGQFIKGGGAIRCLTNPLDVRLGRDLAPVAGGHVSLP